MGTTRTPAEISGAVARERYAWPGGYELFAITDDAGVLCWYCCDTEAESVAESIPGDGWFVVALSHTGEDDGRVECDHCGRVIQEAWDEEEEEV